MTGNGRGDPRNGTPLISFQVSRRHPRNSSTTWRERFSGTRSLPAGRLDFEVRGTDHRRDFPSLLVGREAGLSREQPPGNTSGQSDGRGLFPATAAGWPSAGYYSPVVIWDVTLRQIDTILENSPATTLSLAFSPDGANLAAADIDGTVKIWKTGSWSLAQDPSKPIPLTSALWLSRPTAKFWRPAEEIEPSGSGTRPLGNHAASCRLHRSHGEFHRFLPRRPQTGLVRVLTARSGSGMSILQDPISKSDQILRMNGKAGNTTCLAFSPDGRVLVIPSISGTSETLTLWDPASGLRLASLTEPRSLVLSLSFSPDGRTLAAGTLGGGIELWDVATGQRQPDLRGHSAAVWALAFSPDGRYLVSGGHDGALRLWNMRPN